MTQEDVNDLYEAAHRLNELLERAGRDATFQVHLAIEEHCRMGVGPRFWVLSLETSRKVGPT